MPSRGTGEGRSAHLQGRAARLQALVARLRVTVARVQDGRMVLLRLPSSMRNPRAQSSHCSSVGRWCFWRGDADADGSRADASRRPARITWSSRCGRPPGWWPSSTTSSAWRLMPSSSAAGTMYGLSLDTGARLECMPPRQSAVSSSLPNPAVTTSAGFSCRAASTTTRSRRSARMRHRWASSGGSHLAFYRRPALHPGRPLRGSFSGSS